MGMNYDSTYPSVQTDEPVCVVLKHCRTGADSGAEFPQVGQDQFETMPLIPLGIMLDS